MYNASFFSEQDRLGLGKNRTLGASFPILSPAPREIAERWD